MGEKLPSLDQKIIRLRWDKVRHGGRALSAGLQCLQHANRGRSICPHYEFYCHACKKTFSKILTLVDYEEGGVVCPHCGSHKVEQCWSVLSVVTSRKSA